jgi:hypothetical protein
MPFPRGRNRSLSPARRLMCDFLHFSQRTPTVAVERRMNLEPLVRARQGLAARPGWFTLFLKGFALVARRWEGLRTSSLGLPWPHLHVHACSVAGLPIVRRIGGEEGVLFLQIREPERRALPSLDALIRRARVEPIRAISSFRRQLLTARWPAPVRRLLWRLGLHLFPNTRPAFSAPSASPAWPAWAPPPCTSFRR